MKTKLLLIAGILCITGILSSSAQSIPPQMKNVVITVNIPGNRVIQPGPGVSIIKPMTPGKDVRKHNHKMKPRKRVIKKNVRPLPPPPPPGMNPMLPSR